MKLTVTIDNIGKLKNATIQVRPLTVLAGPNNTGKTFFSKTLYSVFNTMNTDLVWENIKYYLSPLQYAFKIIRMAETKTNNKQNQIQKDVMHSLLTAIKEINKHILSAQKDNQVFSVLEEYPEVKKNLNQFIKKYETIVPFIHKLISKESNLFNDDFFNDIQKSLEYFKTIKQTKPDKILAQGFNQTLEENLTKNFQISNLQKLKKNLEQNATIDVKKTCKVVINNTAIKESYLPLKGLAVLQNYSRVIYLESPFFWKMRDALSNIRPGGFLRTSRKNLLVPKYFIDLMNHLKSDLSGEIAYPDILKKINQTVKGRIILDESGSLKFSEQKGTLHSLTVTATGVVQLGLLALLIDKKIIDKGTILFIDEPETNLHPAWQVEMMNILFELVKNGVHVIMATHSADILKWLEVHLKNHPKDANLMALNEMTLNQDGEVSVSYSDEDLSKQVTTIKKNLTKPYLNLFLDENQ